MERHALSDEQWERLRPLLPPTPITRGRPRRDDRTVVEGILWRLATGVPWRDLPERFGDPIKVHTRFSRWAKSGVWQSVFEHLAADADNEYAMIDSTIVRAHQHSAGAKKKPARTKRSGARVAD